MGRLLKKGGENLREENRERETNTEKPGVPARVEGTGKNCAKSIEKKRVKGTHTGWPTPAWAGLSYPDTVRYGLNLTVPTHQVVGSTLPGFYFRSRYFQRTDRTAATLGARHCARDTTSSEADPVTKDRLRRRNPWPPDYAKNVT